MKKTCVCIEEPRGDPGLGGYSLYKVYRYELIEKDKNGKPYYQVWANAKEYPGNYETCSVHIFKKYFKPIGCITERKKMRKPIQITTDIFGSATNQMTMVTALCDDGSIWFKTPKTEWRKIEPIPQDPKQLPDKDGATRISGVGVATNHSVQDKPISKDRGVDVTHWTYGNPIVYAFPNAGHDHQQAEIRNVLTIGETYTIKHVKVEGFHSSVVLMEHPERRFNSVFFRVD